MLVDTSPEQEGGGTPTIKDQQINRPSFTLTPRPGWLMERQEELVSRSYIDCYIVSCCPRGRGAWILIRFYCPPPTSRPLLLLLLIVCSLKHHKKG